jgi:2-polyprenyl-3-methyl-5-hydroxy-6-metoxy-1,4-benzoquinol methylase
MQLMMASAIHVTNLMTDTRERQPYQEYVAATADDYAQLVRTHDWRGALRHMRADAASKGAGELSLLDVGCGAGAFTAALAASGSLIAEEDEEQGGAAARHHVSTPNQTTFLNGGGGDGGGGGGGGGGALQVGAS